ncbi:MAG: hypothetical protein HY455_02190 [Parcubacteria group bacterium]|nr:hypothetical protein [Parcubacteria group bacterium]
MAETIEETPMSFFQSVQAVLALPDADDRKVVMDRVVARWKEKSPLVADVLAGKTTFENTVRPLVERNLTGLGRFFYSRRAFKTEAFKRVAQETREKVGDTLSFGGEYAIVGPGSRTNYRIFLTEPLQSFWPSFFTALSIILLITSVLWVLRLIFVGLPAFANLPWFLLWGSGIGAFFGVMFSSTEMGLRVDNRRELAKSLLREAQLLDKQVRSL